jgi:hypothetical protein
MRALRQALAAVLFLSLCIPAMADSANPLTDRFSIDVGTFFVTTKTNVRVDSDSGNGSDIDVERDLGIGDTDSIRLDAYWRFATRHKVRLLYFDTSRTASREIDRDIVYNGTTYPVNATIDTRFETKVAEIAYEYAFLRSDRYEVAGSIGIHNLRFQLGLEATGGATSVARANNANADGPLPVIGLRGVWRLGEHVHLDGQMQFFRLSFDPYDGRLEDYNIAVIWMPLKRLGLGLGYNEFVTRLDVTADRFDGRLRWHYGGARLFAAFSF